MKNKLIKNIVYISLFVTIMVICSWITIPFTIPFTLQTFAIFSALLFLNGKRGTIAILVYLLLGVIGIPVFSGFNSGLGYLLGTTGGYLLGFIIMGIIMIIFELFCNKKIIPLILGLIACYIVGTLWMSYYLEMFNLKGIISNLLIAVVPFIIPDIIKLILALFIKKRIKIDI